MRVSDLSFNLFRVLLAPALIGTLYLYLYPVFLQCGFPKSANAGQKAPFRLLAFGDPQLEGDTSLPGNGRAEERWPSVKRVWEDVGRDGVGSLMSSLGRESPRLWQEDLPKVLRTYHKGLDLWGNDLYLAHIHRTMNWYTDPTHVVVLGDLLGSQWIDDQEYERRSKRFWRKVFGGSRKVPRLITDYEGGEPEVLGKDKDWKRRVITVAGNHDIGYSGDIDEHRIERFENLFGRVNWETRFALHNSSGPLLRLVVLNSMNLDMPASDPQLHQYSIDYLNQKLYHDVPNPDSGTVVLTHIPLHKASGLCIDEPLVAHFPPHLYYGGIKEQNHLSSQISELMLNGAIGPERDRSTIILNGHDHAGCDVYHSKRKNVDVEELSESVTLEDIDQWKATHYSQARTAQVTNDSLTGVREITVRSMMGEFGGNAGLLSAWWDDGGKAWRFEYATCAVGVQHLWWAVHVLDLILVVLVFVGPISAGYESMEVEEEKRKNAKKNVVEGKKRQ